MSLSDSLWFLGYPVSAVILVALGALRPRRAWAVAGVALSLAFAAALTEAVFRANGYTGNGSSNWSNHGAASHAIYATTMVGALVVATLFAVLAARNTKPPRFALAACGFVDLVFGYVVLYSFDNY